MLKLEHAASTYRLRLSDSQFNLSVAVLAIASGILWSLLCGKDLNWDQLNYHYYLGYSFFNDRLAKDFLPASGQSYLNPAAYVPFYWMVAHHWSAILISALLSAVQSLNIVLAYYIFAAILPVTARNFRSYAMLAAALALTSPMLLCEIGTTFADAMSSVFVLGAIVCGLRSDVPQTRWHLLPMLAGMLMGCAVAIKLSNAIFGPPCALLILFMQRTWSRRILAMCSLGIGVLVGVVLLQGYWGWQLWKALGNPFFPYFANYFPSDIFPKEGAKLERFLPDSFWDVLTLPFRMTLLRPWIYVEATAPDLRFAALVLLGVIGGAYVLAARRRAAIDASASPNHRRALAIGAYFFIAFGLWQWSSGNGRYGLMISVLCAPVLVLVAYTVFNGARIGVYVLTGLLVLQVFHLQNGQMRWAKGAWSADWFEVSVPARLKSEPNLYVSVGRNSSSFLLPFLSPGSAFTNPIGQISFELNGTVGERLTRLFAQYEGHVRVIAGASPDDSEQSVLADWVRLTDFKVAPLGYAVDGSDCEFISSADGATPIAGPLFEKGHRRLRFITCRLVLRPYAHAAARAEMTKLFREVVAWCPKLFKPSYTSLEQTPYGWTANYDSTDATLAVTNNRLLGHFHRSSLDLSFGTVDKWKSGARPSCDSFPDKPREIYNFR